VLVTHVVLDGVVSKKYGWDVWAGRAIAPFVVEERSPSARAAAAAAAASLPRKRTTQRRDKLQTSRLLS
jgi:hypothetical protein